MSTIKKSRIERTAYATLMAFALGLLMSSAMHGRFPAIAGEGVVTAKSSKAQMMADRAPTKDWETRPWGLLSFDLRTRCPRWTLERLDEASLEINLKRGDHAFHTDPEMPHKFRVVPGDYDNSGFDRGHLACAANHRDDQEKFDAPFAMSNMMPQYPNVNEIIWAQLEDAGRKIPGEETIVWVITAPVWKPNETGRINVRTIKGDIWIPTHCLKAILIEREKMPRECKAWLVPNVPDPKQEFDAYRIDTDDAELAVGLDLWAFLPDDEEKRLEGRK